MQVLYDLVRRLIMLAILAGFFELLLPGNTFKSYCRLVIGLLVLLMLLQPAMDFLNQGWQLDQLMTEPNLSLETYAYDNQILRQQTQELVEEQLAEQVAPLVAQRYPQADISVHLAADFDEYGNLISLNSIEIMIDPKQDSEALVKPVRIGQQAHQYQPLDDEDLYLTVAGGLGMSAEQLSVYLLGTGRGQDNDD